VSAVTRRVDTWLFVRRRASFQAATSQGQEVGSFETSRVLVVMPSVVETTTMAFVSAVMFSTSVGSENT